MPVTLLTTPRYPSRRGRRPESSELWGLTELSSAVSMFDSYHIPRVSGSRVSKVGFEGSLQSSESCIKVFQVVT